MFPEWLEKLLMISFCTVFSGVCVIEIFVYSCHILFFTDFLILTSVLFFWLFAMDLLLKNFTLCFYLLLCN